MGVLNPKIFNFPPRQRLVYAIKKNPFSYTRSFLPAGSLPGTLEISLLNNKGLLLSGFFYAAKNYQQLSGPLCEAGEEHTKHLKRKKKKAHTGERICFKSFRIPGAKMGWGEKADYL